MQLMSKRTILVVPTDRAAKTRLTSTLTLTRLLEEAHEAKSPTVISLELEPELGAAPASGSSKVAVAAETELAIDVIQVTAKRPK